jgi:CRISPR-associated protein Cas1
MMKKILNTLYVTTPESYLQRDGENIVVSIEQNPVFRAPIHLFEGVVYFGYLGASPGAIELCIQNGVTVSLHSRSGRFLGRIVGPTTGNILLRKQQYRLADCEPEKAVVAPKVLLAKILNSRTVLLRARRDHVDKVEDTLDASIERLAEIARLIQEERALNILRGYEGDAAQVYFGVFNSLLIGNDPLLSFNGRSRRPPLDPVNAVLSYMYAISAHDCTSALESVGLDSSAGFLHRDRPGRRSLALDLMEEFRACLIDRFVLSLFNRQQLKKRDFIFREGNTVLLQDDARKRILSSWQDRKQETIMHPWIKERVQVGLLPYVQARLLARFIQGDLDTYPSFIWK